MATNRVTDVAGRVVGAGERIARSATNRIRSVAGSGSNGGVVRYEERSIEELRELAAKREVHGRSEMSKEELIQALRAGN